MNILVLNWRDPRNPRAGGAEIATLEHAKGWVKAGHTVTWFTSRFAGSKQEELYEGIHIVRMGGVYSTYLRALLYYLWNGQMFDLVVDEVHGIPYFTPLYVRRKKIVFIHEVAGDIWRYMLPMPFSFIGRGIEHVMFLLYKKVPFMTVSQSTKEDLRRLGIQKVHVIHNGVTLPQKLNHYTKEKNPTFLFVSRLVKMKGVEDIIEAFVIMQKKLPEATLWIVGQGDKHYETKIKETVEKLRLKHIVFCGRVTEEKKFELMARAHLLLHASVKEGWGLVVLEAASVGTPSIVYDVSGLRDAVHHNKTGIRVRQNTPAALADTAINIMDNKTLYEKLSKNAVAFAKNFSWDKSTNESLKLIENI